MLLLCVLLSVVCVSYGAPASDLMTLHNRYRVRSGLSRLRCSLNLRRQAQQWAQVMASQHRLYHDTTPTGGYSPGWHGWGENVGYGQIGSSGDDQIFRAFLNSPPHKKNIRGKWTHIGVGYAKSGNTAWWTVKFANYGKKNIPQC